MKICNLELKSYRQFLKEQKLPEKSYRQFLKEQKLPEESDADMDDDDSEEN